jgi:hypothetical protein
MRGERLSGGGSVKEACVERRVAKGEAAAQLSGVRWSGLRRVGGEAVQALGMAAEERLRA